MVRTDGGGPLESNRLRCGSALIAGLADGDADPVHGGGWAAIAGLSAGRMQIACRCETTPAARRPRSTCHQALVSFGRAKTTSAPIPILFARSLTAELLTLYCHLRVECGAEGWRWDGYSRVPSRSTFGSAAKRITRLTEDHSDHGTQCK